MNFEAAKKYIIDRLRKELSSSLYYHSYEHTMDVYKTTKYLAKLEGIEGEDLDLMRIAALYHDIGFIYQYSDNEKIAAKIASETLPEFGFTDKQIKTVCGIIIATTVSVEPKNKLEEIVKDADLDYLGRADFHPTAKLLHKELNANGFKLNKKQWDEVQVKFLKKHKYYTKSAIDMRKLKKQVHLRQIRERLKPTTKKSNT